VNEAFARATWPGTEAIGHRIRLPGMDKHAAEWMTIIGVVADVRDKGLDAPPEPMMFVPYAQRPERLAWNATVLVRTAGEPGALAAAVRERAHAADPNVPVQLSTLETVIDESVARRRFSTTVLGTFAALALVLAALGIYGVLAYSVAQRGREIGVRMALGAAPARVGGMIVRDAMRAVIPGIVIGLAGALALTRLLRGMLYEVKATDPTTYAAVSLVLLAVAATAAWIPARRATRVNPVTALRGE